MGIFANRQMSTVTPDKGGNYFKPGKHLVQVLRCKGDVNSKKQAIFVAECLVVESDNPDVTPGCKWSFVKNLDGSKFPESTKGEILSFLQAGAAALADANNEERAKDISTITIDDEFADFLVGVDNPLAGVFLAGETWNKETQAGGNYTKHSWDVVSDLKRAQELAAKVS